jgi:uncharacterized membrane protein YccC
VSNNESSCPKELHKEKQSTEMRPPAASVKRVKKRVVSDENSNSEISVAIQQLDKIAQNAAEEKPYDQFGKFVAAELRQLPQRQAILLQQEIQNSIIRSKLTSLEPAVNSNSREASHVPFSPVPFSPSSDYSLSTSSNDDDVLKQVMFQTFGPSSL